MGAPSLRSQEHTPPSADVPTPGQVSLWDKVSLGREPLVQKKIQSATGLEGLSRAGVVGAASPGSVSRALLPVTAPAVVLVQPSLTTACRTESQECPAVYRPGAPASAAAIRDPRLLRGSSGALTDSLHKGN